MYAARFFILKASPVSKGLVNGGRYLLSGAASSAFSVSADGLSQTINGVNLGRLYLVRRGNGTNTINSDPQEIIITRAVTPEDPGVIYCGIQNNG